jgi:predicted Zn finger-like uncharacterized protein
MLIICKQCTTSYSVPTNKIGATGRNVKCAKCHNIWYVEPQTPLNVIDNNVDKLYSESHSINLNHDQFYQDNIDHQVPALIDEEVSITQKFITLILLLGIIVTIMVFYKSKIDHVYFIEEAYAKYGLSSTKNIILEDLKTYKTTKDEAEALYVEGNITNKKNHKSPLPNLRVTVKNKMGQKLLEQTINNGGKFLEKGEKYNFSNVIKNLDPSSNELIIDIGNSLELLTR